MEPITPYQPPSPSLFSFQWWGTFLPVLLRSVAVNYPLLPLPREYTETTELGDWQLGVPCSHSCKIMTMCMLPYLCWGNYCKHLLETGLENLYRQCQTVTRADCYWSMLPKSHAGKLHSFCLAASGLWEIHLLSSHVRHCIPSANMGSNNYLSSFFHSFLSYSRGPGGRGSGFSNPVQYFPTRRVPWITTLWLEESAA